MIVIEAYNDPKFEIYSEDFYNNFHPDDWSYIIVVPVRQLLKADDFLDMHHPQACDVQIKKIPHRNSYMVVSYHS